MQSSLLPNQKDDVQSWWILCRKWIKLDETNFVVEKFPNMERCQFSTYRKWHTGDTTFSSHFFAHSVTEHCYAELPGSKIKLESRFSTNLFQWRIKRSHRRCSIKTAFLKNFVKHLWHNLCKKLIEKEALAQVFFGQFCKIFKSTFFTEHLLESASKEVP